AEQALPGLKAAWLALAGVTLAVLVAVLCRAVRRSAPRPGSWAGPFLLLGGGSLLTGGLLILLHHALGVKYPQGRTGWTRPRAPPSVCCCGRKVCGGRPRRGGGWPCRRAAASPWGRPTS